MSRLVLNDSLGPTYPIELVLRPAAAGADSTKASVG
jgi:hypothetical protein